MDLSNVSTEALERELERRKLPRPLPSEEVDWSEVYDATIEYVTHCGVAGHDCDGLRVINRAVKAVYGRPIWAMTP